jgi:uncharacterized protein (TIGR01244 family)
MDCRTQYHRETSDRADQWTATSFQLASEGKPAYANGYAVLILGQSAIVNRRLAGIHSAVGTIVRIATLTLGLAFAVLTLASTLEAKLKELPQVRFPEPQKVVSGALDATHLEAVKAAGIQHVVTLRPAEENPDFDEPSAVAALGLEFHAIPIKGPQSLTRENAQALHKILDEIGDEPALLHCSSGNRVGALIALREAWINGKSPDEAIAIGKRWGLAGLEKAVGTALSTSPASP